MAPNPNEVEQVVARTLRDSLVKLQQTTEELNQAVGDLVSACASSRPSNSLPSMLRARSAAASLAASLGVLSKFVVTALQASSPAETDLFAMLPRAASPVPQAEPAAPNKPAPAELAPPQTPPQVLPPQAPPAQTIATEPPVAESPESEPASPAEVSPAELPISVSAESEPSASESESIEPAMARSEVAQEVEKVEPLAPRAPEPAPVPAALERPEEFTVVADSEASKPPILELPPFEKPSPFETAFEPVVFEEPRTEVVEPVEVEPASKQETVTETTPEAAPGTGTTTTPEIAELYELATWKEPPSGSEPVSEVQTADAEPPGSEEPVLEAPATVPMRASEDSKTAPFEVASAEALNIEEATAQEPAIEMPAGIDATGLVGASTLNAEMSLIQELPPEAKGFDLLTLSVDQQELHRRANRVAKVSMQDVKMLRPRDVALGKENKDICLRLREDIEKAHKEYDRRFHAILDHPVDYFYDWMVEILGDGDPETLGDYPYPSPVLRR